MACVGGGSNAMGMFYNFISDKDVKLIGCEAAGKGVDTALTAAIATGSLGVFHGMKSYFCQDKYGQIAPVYSISAGLDYPGIGPEHAYLHDTKPAQDMYQLQMMKQWMLLNTLQKLKELFVPLKVHMRLHMQSK